MYSSGFSQVSVKESTYSLWSVIISFTKSAFVERDLIFNKPSFIMCFYVLYTFFICWTSIKLLLINWFGRFLYFIVRGTDIVSIVWYLGESVYMCWELTDFCDVRRLADGQFSQSVCFLTWAPVSQVRTLRLFAIFLEIRAAPPQEGWRPSLFNRSGLPQKLVQLSIKSVLFCGHHLDIQPLSDNSLLWISSPR